MSDFKKIPYVGEATETDLLALGYTDIASLKVAVLDEMFEHTKALDLGSNGYFLNVYRMIYYYANTPRLDKNQVETVALA
ncbi:Pathogenicity locus [Campylobacter concisus]|uniref:Pathogenicity locus n=1 Tax=Campylobacter concisus TaxID=199 RepID=A0A1X0U399_9BACT|nr:helix-hairpin-helix domain-containing protein [Campylobacter concisus]ORI08394.1 Pathogenicity locus [Campylobacter concisus]